VVSYFVFYVLFAHFLSARKDSSQDDVVCVEWDVDLHSIIRSFVRSFVHSFIHSLVCTMLKIAVLSRYSFAVN